MTKLSARQTAFIHYMMKTGDPRESFKKAGYEPKNANSGAYRLLRCPSIRAELQKRQERRNKALSLDEDYELKRAIEVLDRCMTPEQVRDGYGNPTTDESGKFVLRFDSSGANSALLTICKLRGKFRDKKVIEHDFSDRAARLAELLNESDPPLPTGKRGQTQRKTGQT